MERETVERKLPPAISLSVSRFIFISIFLIKQKLNYYSKYIDNKYYDQIVALE